jgi:disulfide oxidoreductase YuzD
MYERKFDNVICKVIYLDLQREDTREVTEEIIEKVKEKYE